MATADSPRTGRPMIRLIVQVMEDGTITSDLDAWDLGANVLDIERMLVTGVRDLNQIHLRVLGFNPEDSTEDWPVVFVETAPPSGSAT